MTCGISKCAVTVSSAFFTPHLHLSRDSQSTSMQLIAINRSLIGKIPLRKY
nr:MAG TPA: hypothetical protein [Caudoviricetes sp.]DAV60141.1 MAG TPA: hypothetical protein [Caudoviricetes sp.]